jgi:hypothetical protein
MTRRRELEGVVRSWLHEDGHEDADRVLFSVLNSLDTTPQRHAGWLARRLPIMNNKTVRYGIAAAAVLVIALLGMNMLPEVNLGPPLTPSPTAVPSAAGTQTPAPTADLGLPLLAEQPTYPELLAANTYLIDAPFPVRASVTVPEGWSMEGPYRREAVGLGVLTESGMWAGWGLAFKDIDDVFVDPCATDQRLRDIGSSADELVAALIDLPGHPAEGPVPVTVGGLVGQRVDLSIPEMSAADCPGGHLLWTMDGLTMHGRPGDVHNLIILEVQGRRLAIELDDYAHSSIFEMESYATPFDPEAHAQDLVELHQMLESVQFH